MSIIEISPTSGNQTTRIQAAIDRAASTHGCVRLLPGLHQTGSLSLRSNLTFEICAGATLRAIEDPSAFHFFESSAFSRMDVAPWSAFLHADGVENLRIIGYGTIEGGGEYAFFQNGISVSPDRPYGIHLIRCRSVVIKNLTLRNSAYWMLRLLECDRISLRDLDIYNHANMNNDGIDIDSSRDVQVRGCRIDTADDALCIKSEGASPAENIICSDCQLATHASGVKLGTGSIGGFRNIVVSNIVIHRSRSTTMKHPLGFWGGITGIDIATVDGGPLSNVKVSQIVMEGMACPLFLRLGKRLSRKMKVGGACTESDRSSEKILDFPDSKTFEDVLISQISARNLGGFPAVVCGYPGAPIRRVSLSDISLQHAEGGPDQQPPTEFNDQGYPNIGMFGSSRELSFTTKLNAHGLFTRCVEQFTVSSFSSIPAQGDRRVAEFHYPSST